MRIEEKALILPALYIINAHEAISTSELIRELTGVFNPSGEDAEILSGRKDTKFSQIVRNLMGSHYKTNEMAALTQRSPAGRNAKFSLTEKGKQYLEANSEAVLYLFANPFEYNDMQELSEKIASSGKSKKRIVVYDENDITSEGKARRTSGLTRQRSAKLREMAVQEYKTAAGGTECFVCGFNFEKVYGEIGKDYIEIHHERPVFQYPGEGFEEFSKEAVKRMKPLCSNCHSMVHRKMKEPVSVRELIEIVGKPGAL
ncbi:MAG: hypothetical protein FWG32_02375 [Oscillospiraceae bacterium]|nr:hypothetical protein [Oscillospiraceae bacterium]